MEPGNLSFCSARRLSKDGGKATKRHSEESRQGLERFFALARGERLRPVEWYRCFMAGKKGANRQRCAGLNEWRLPGASRTRILGSSDVGVGLIDYAPVLGSWRVTNDERHESRLNRSRQSPACLQKACRPPESWADKSAYDATATKLKAAAPPAA